MTRRIIAIVAALAAFSFSSVAFSDQCKLYNKVYESPESFCAELVQNMSISYYGNADDMVYVGIDEQNRCMGEIKNTHEIQYFVSQCFPYQCAVGDIYNTEFYSALIQEYNPPNSTIVPGSEHSITTACNQGCEYMISGDTPVHCYSIPDSPNLFCTSDFVSTGVQCYQAPPLETEDVCPLGFKSGIFDGQAVCIPDSGSTDTGDTGTGDTGTGDTGIGDTGIGDTGTGDTGTGDTGAGDEGTGDTGTGDEGTGDTGTGSGGASGGGTGTEDTGTGDTGTGDTGTGDTGTGDTGTGDTGTGDTGIGGTGSGDTGTGDTGTGDDSMGDGDGDGDGAGVAAGLAGPPALREPVSWWEKQYPDGLSGVYASFLEDVHATPLFQLAESFKSCVPSGGSCPSWHVNVNLGGGLNFGSYELQPACWIWDAIRAIMIFSALLLARRLVFGG